MERGQQRSQQRTLWSPGADEGIRGHGALEGGECLQRAEKAYKGTKGSLQPSTLPRLGELRASCRRLGSLGVEPTMDILVTLLRNSCQGKESGGLG